MLAWLSPSVGQLGTDRLMSEAVHVRLKRWHTREATLLQLYLTQAHARFRATVPAALIGMLSFECCSSSWRR